MLKLQTYLCSTSFYTALEKLVYNRNIKGKCKILTDNQFGFRKQHSTEYTSVALLYHKISSAIDNNEKTEGFFIDFSKAFDTVNHQILLDKLLQYGFRGVAFNWLEDYLNNKQHFFSVQWI